MLRAGARFARARSRFFALLRMTARKARAKATALNAKGAETGAKDAKAAKERPQPSVVGGGALGWGWLVRRMSA